MCESRVDTRRDAVRVGTCTRIAGACIAACRSTQSSDPLRFWWFVLTWTCALLRRVAFARPSANGTIGINLITGLTDWSKAMAEKDAIRIRPGTKEDAEQVVQFITNLAIFEKEPLSSVKVTPADIVKYMETGLIHILMAEHLQQNGQWAPAGFALYFYNFSTWEGKPGLYLEDLYVDQQVRGRGIGAALLSALAKIAVDKGCARYQWQVLDWNQPAIDFYEKKGGKVLKEWLTVRVEGEALEQLASGTR